MSRRIIFFALAASATLIATQASADRECFEDSCRHFEMAEPTTSSLPPPAAAEEGTAAEASAAAVVAPRTGEARAAVDANVAAPKLAPARALPQVAEAPQVAPAKAIATPAPRPPEQSFADHEPARLAPRTVKPAPAPVPFRVTHALPQEDVRAASAVPTVLPPPPIYRPRRAAAAAPAIVTGPGAIYAEDDVVRVYPNPRHDPAWKLCQLDQRESDQRRCGAYSYHPFGTNGYRPYGTYGEERGRQVYMIAPSAKIISIDSDD
jgi:hypothetical protein